MFINLWSHRLHLVSSCLIESVTLLVFDGFHLSCSALARVVNRAADGGITSLHMAALNSHTECLQLLLDLSANVNAVTIQDGTTIDLIGSMGLGNLVMNSEY